MGTSDSLIDWNSPLFISHSIVDRQQVCKDHTIATQPSFDPELVEFGGQLFFRLWRASHTRIAEGLESIGLTPALFGILNYLGARDGAIQLEIASAMGIDPSALVSLIDELER